MSLKKFSLLFLQPLLTVSEVVEQYQYWDAHDIISTINQNQTSPEEACLNQPKDHYFPFGDIMKRCDDPEFGFIQSILDDTPEQEMDPFKAMFWRSTNSFTYRENDKVIVPWFIECQSNSNGVCLADRDGSERLPTLRTNLLRQMAHIEKYTCIRFQERNSVHTNLNLPHLHIRDIGTGCNANVGWISSSRKAYINLGPNCDWTGVHEIGHALGYKHEHQRADRRYNLMFNHHLMNDPTWIQYDKILTSRDVYETHGVGYDGNSELHYKTTRSGNHKFSDLFGQSASANKDLNDDFYSADSEFSMGFSLSRLDIYGWNLDHNCKEIYFPRNKPGRLAANDGTWVMDGVFFNDDDKFDFSNSVNIQGDGTNFKIGVVNESLGLRFFQNSFNIRRRMDTNSNSCFSSSGSTQACNDINTASDHLFTFSAFETSTQVIEYDTTASTCSGQSCDLSSNLSTHLRNVDFTGIRFESGVYKNARDEVLIPVDQLCDYENGFCQFYCEQGTNERTCSCAPGWHLNADGTTCSETNECDNNPCGDFTTSKAYCLNLYGNEVNHEGYKCRCEWGYIWNNDLKVCETPVDIASYDWFQLKISSGSCITMYHPSGYIRMETCDESNLDQNFVILESRQIMHFSGKCLSVHPSGCNDYGTWSGNIYGSPRLVECEENQPAQMWTLHGSGSSFNLQASCSMANDWNWIWTPINNFIYLAGAAPNHPWEQSFITEQEKSSWASFEMSDFTGTINTEIQANDWCVHEFERSYAIDTDFDGNDDLVCIDHKSGRYQIYNFHVDHIQEFENSDCQNDPLHTQVLKGKFSDSISFICLNLYDPDNEIIQFCQDSERSGTLFEADFNNDGYTDLGCYHFDGQLSIAFGSQTLSSVNDILSSIETRQLDKAEDYLVPLAGDFNGDGLTDIFLSHASTGKYYTKFQKDSTPQTWTPGSQASVNSCLEVDEAVDVFGSCEIYKSHCVSGQYNHYINMYCQKTCGNCVGTSTCTNSDWFCARIQRMGLCSAYPGCQSACGTCTTTYESQPSPVFEESFWYVSDTSEKWCHDSNKDLSVADINGDGKDDLLCHDWVTGSLTYVASNGDGSFNINNPVAILGNNFCVSKYNRVASFEADFKDQSTGRFTTLKKASGGLDYLCFAKNERVIYTTGSTSNTLDITDSFLQSEVILTTSNSDEMITVSLEVLRYVLERFLGFRTVTNGDLVLVDLIPDHGCYCKVLNDPLAELVGDTVSDIDQSCKALKQCFQCTDCDDGDLDIILIEGTDGTYTCDPSLSDCAFDKCMCMLDFAEEGRDSWDFSKLEDSDLQNIETCGASEGLIGGSTNGSIGGSSSGTSNGSSGGAEDMCLNKKRRK